MKGWRYDYKTGQWIKIMKLSRKSKAWLSTVKGRAKRALKHFILSKEAK